MVFPVNKLRQYGFQNVFSHVWNIILIAALIFL
jgi:hypothetical protein